MKVYDPEPFKKMFAQIDTEIEQVERNKNQGVLGRQLGLTKVVNMKMHVKDLYKDIMNKVALVQEEVKDGDFDKAAQVQNQEFDKLKSEGKKITNYIPKVESLEVELELLDKGNHDEELNGLVSNIESLVQKSKKELLKQQKAQKKQEAETKQKEEAAEYVYVPKEGFNWDNVSGAISDVI